MSDPTPPASSTYELYPPSNIEVSERPVVRQRYWLHALLLVSTFFTMLVVGARMYDNFVHGLATFPGGDLALYEYIAKLYHNPSELLNGMFFAVPLVLILLCHEMGHYLYCVHYGVDATLPFFIPFTAPIGTLGAFIRIRSGIHSRAALFDIGIAGPIAGFVASCIVLAFALPFSRPLAPGPVDIYIGTPLIFNIVNGILGGLGVGASAKLGLEQVALHPAAVAAWVGMFATFMNLLPGGQLDGGHIVYSLVPRAHRWITRLSVAALVLMIWSWWGWILWAVMLYFSGHRHPQVAPWPDLSGRRRLVSLVALVLLVLTFVPQPFRRGNSDMPPMGAGEYVREFISHLERAK